MSSNLLVLTGAALAIAYLFSRRLRTSRRWQATLTPLASIIGSGFLVSAPLLRDQVGVFASVAMAGLVFVAYLIGGAVRFNIRYLEPAKASGTLSPGVERVEALSEYALVLAYWVSISYYVALLGIFLLNGLGVHDDFVAKLVSTGVLAAIALIGHLRGLELLEKVEGYAASVNLAIIFALLVGLAGHNAQELASGTWQIPSVVPEMSLDTLRVILGLLIMVQGFETSRFLGSKYSAEERIETMRLAQLISAVVYVSFFVLLLPLFAEAGSGHGLTWIIDASALVAGALPIMITVSAVGSQFSASVADDVGAGGLISELTHGRIPERSAFLLVGAVTMTLIWTADVFEIISWASRAFAFFYALQCLSAMGMAHQHRDLEFRRERVALYGLLSLVCFAVCLFGISAE